MTDAGKRIDGWKAIAGYFGRDRTTAMRWARDRALPVRHIPGGKQKSVFALEHELAAWARNNIEFASATPTSETTTLLDAPGEPDAPSPIPIEPPLLAPVAPPAMRPALHQKLRALYRWGTNNRVWFLLLACFAAVLLLLPSTSKSAADGKRAMPRSASVAVDYVAARDAWGRRTPEDLALSIRLYGKVIKAEPNFAPARAGLAEAWLIIREYGGVGDAQAFGAARVSAERALSVDPNLAAAHRTLGFIDYWWDNDPAGAVKEFKRAFEIDNEDAQTHFWFANILADLGRDQAAERHYARARLLAPGLPAIAVEHACAQWQAGRDDLALGLLTNLKRRYPTDATISNCLTWVYIAKGDMIGAARAYADLAALRKEPDLSRLASNLQAAVARQPETAYKVLIADARRELSIGTRRLREVPAFYASSMNDRSELITLMSEAAVQGERWYSPCITARIAARWREDREVMQLLAQVRGQIPPLDVL